MNGGRTGGEREREGGQVEGLGGKGVTFIIDEVEHIFLGKHNEQLVFCRYEI